MQEYPTKNGVPVSTKEIWLPNSELDLSKRESFNVHHTCYTAREFGSRILTRVMRSIETHQEALPIDVHEYLHKKYKPVKLPTPRQAMDEIYRAKAAGERLKVKEDHHYVIKEITDQVMRVCIADYQRLKNR
jgi:hypothetical protein